MSMNPDEMDFAVVIAVETYQVLDQLKGAIQDAEDFIVWLTEKAGFSGPEGKKRIAFVRNDNPAKPEPTKEQVDAAFRYIINEATAPGVSPRRLYVYYVGHGSLPTNDYAELVTLLFAPYSDDEYYECLSGSSCRLRLAARRLFREQLFFLDCCRNPTDGKIEGQPPTFSLRTGDIEPIPQQWIYFGAERSAESHRRPLYGQGVDRGFFTAALLAGLNGEAAERVKDSDRFQITPRSLWRWLEDQVPTIAESKRRIQYPDWYHCKSPQEADMVILADTRPPVIRTLMTVPEIRWLHIYSADMRSVETCAVGHGEARIRLREGRFIVYAVNEQGIYSKPFELVIGQQDLETPIALGEIVWP